ncbi:hypothetical protein BGX31_002427 [Mortierella sp. GBA43]|nr:hypothetical protein BGX31_002427 [Mortierella sp. GBA43]
MATTNPLDIPEILAQVGSYIVPWNHCKKGECDFDPQDMLSCLLVSHHFRSTLLPIFWYTFDEEVMSHVPVDLVSKYSPYFRAYYNYGSRRDFPENQREVGTRLTHLTFAGDYGHRLSIQDIKLIKSNPQLKYLKIQDWIESHPSYEGLFDNLTGLEHLQYSVQGPGLDGLHQRLFQPISAKLKVLHFGSINGSLGLQGLDLPSLRELRVTMYDSQDARDLLKACPNLESIGPFAVVGSDQNNVIKALRTDLCPRLKELRFTGLYDVDVVETIKTRIGLERLDVQVLYLSESLARAISHQTSLTHLSVHADLLAFSTIVLFLGSCGQLKHVSLESISDRFVNDLLCKDPWKNPEMLESLKIRTLRIRTCGLGRMRSIRDSPMAHTEKLFNTAAVEGFVRLEKIEIDGVVHRKDRPRS